MSVFQNIKKLTNNNYAFNLAEENPYAVSNWIDTGCYSLNAVLSDGDIFKGIPDGKRIMLAGESGTAKSLFTSYLIKSYLTSKANSKVVFFESEGSTTVDMAKDVGIKEEDMIILPVMTIEETRTQIIKIIDAMLEDSKKIKKDNADKKEKYEKKLKAAIKKKVDKKDYPKEPEYEEIENIIFVLDSLGMLSTRKETEDVASGSEKKDMTRAAVLRGFARVMSLKLSLIQSPFLIVNHTYQTMDKYNPQAVSGGGGPRYMADIILILTKAKAKDESTKEQIGVEIKCKVDKSRYMKENKFVKLLLSFKNGLFKFSDLVRISGELDIFEKEGFSYILPDGEKVKMKDMRIPKDSIQYFNEKVLEGIQKGIKKDFEFGQDE